MCFPQADLPLIDEATCLSMRSPGLQAGASDTGLATSCGFGSALAAGVGATLETGAVYGTWVDLDADGTWEQVREHIVAGLALTAGVNVVGIPVPADIVAIVRRLFALQVRRDPFRGRPRGRSRARRGRTCGRRGTPSGQSELA